MALISLCCKFGSSWRCDFDPELPSPILIRKTSLLTVFFSPFFLISNLFVLARGGRLDYQSQVGADCVIGLVEPYLLLVVDGSIVPRVLFLCIRFLFNQVRVCHLWSACFHLQSADCNCIRLLYMCWCWYWGLYILDECVKEYVFCWLW